MQDNKVSQPAIHPPISRHSHSTQKLEITCRALLPSFKCSIVLAPGSRCFGAASVARATKMLESRAENKRTPQPHRGCDQGDSNNVKWDQETSLGAGNCHLPSSAGQGDNLASRSSQVRNSSSSAPCLLLLRSPMTDQSTAALHDPSFHARHKDAIQS